MLKIKAIHQLVDPASGEVIGKAGTVLEGFDAERWMSVVKHERWCYGDLDELMNWGTAWEYACDLVLARPVFDLSGDMDIHFEAGTPITIESYENEYVIAAIGNVTIPVFPEEIKEA